MGKQQKKKKRHKGCARRQQAAHAQPACQPVNWMQRNLELLNRIQPKVAEAVERKRNEDFGSVDGGPSVGN